MTDVLTLADIDRAIQFALSSGAAIKPSPCSGCGKDFIIPGEQGPSIILCDDCKAHPIKRHGLNLL